MKRAQLHVAFVGFLLVAGAVASVASDKAPKLSVEEIVSKHLDSIGSADARAAAHSRSAQGTVTFSERIGGAVHLDGTASIISEGGKAKYAFKFASPQYPGEQFAFDGKTVGVAMIDQQSRSRLGGFLVSEPELVGEGVFGGVLGTGWPLLDVKISGAKLKSESIKKTDNRDLYALSYTPRKRNSSGDLTVELYFDSTTFHHVLTVYRLATTPVDQGQTADPGNVTTIVEERFDDFHAVDGLTLPMAWDVRVQVEPGKAVEYEWKVALQTVVHNKL